MLAIASNAPKGGPLSHPTAFQIKTCDPCAVLTFDPAPEDARIDVAALARDLVDSVVQGRSSIQETSSLPDKVGDTPSALHDRGSGFKKNSQFLSFRLFLLSGLDAGRGVAKLGDTFFGDP
jgi:hypothetical protein